MLVPGKLYYDTTTGTREVFIKAEHDNQKSGKEQHQDHCSI